MTTTTETRIEDLCELLERERRERRKLAAESATKDAVIAILADERRARARTRLRWVTSARRADNKTRLPLGFRRVMSQAPLVEEDGA